MSTNAYFFHLSADFILSFYLWCVLGCFWVNLWNALIILYWKWNIKQISKKKSRSGKTLLLAGPNVWQEFFFICNSAIGRWFSPGTPASSTAKTGHHDIAEILLKVALNTIKSNQINFLKFKDIFHDNANNNLFTTSNLTHFNRNPRHDVIQQFRNSEGFRQFNLVPCLIITFVAVLNSF